MGNTAIWEVWYDDKTCISSEDATPFSIPKRKGVQVIVQQREGEPWRTLSGVDKYVWDDRGRGAKWWKVNDDSGLDMYLQEPGFKCVLYGTWIETEDFNDIFNHAREKFGEKHTFAPDERKPDDTLLS